MTNATAPKANTIVLDLEKGDYNGQLTAKDLVHRDVYEQLKDRITQDLTYAKAHSRPNSDDKPCNGTQRKEAYPFGSNLVYFIDGSRGAGKTTFMRAVYEALQGKINGADCVLASLAYIDPTRLENSEVILLRVLERINTKVKRACQRGSQEDKRKLNAFENAFNKLAPGLALFGAKHDPLEQFDPDLYYAWGLERNAASHSLRRDFHDLVEHACGIMGVQALVIAFDDADTDSHHAIKVLECVRKYLDTPQLLVLLTGDMELYSLLVRDHFYKAMGSNRHDQTPERQDQRAKMVDHLEDQYLLKLFPAQRRYKLQPLSHLTKDKADYQIKVPTGNTDNQAHSNSGVQLPLREAVECLLKKSVRLKSAHDIDLFRDFLLNQPLRSVVQLLSRCLEKIPKDKRADPMAFLRDAPYDKEWAEAVIDGLRALALGPMYKMHIDADRVSAHDFEALTEGMFNAWLQDGADPNGIYFRPDTSDNSFNAVLTALAAESAWQCAGSPANTLRLMLQGVGTTTAYGSEIAKKQNNAADSSHVDKNFRRSMAVGQAKDALHWSHQYVALIIENEDSSSQRTQVTQGVIGTGLRKANPKDKTYIAREETLNRILENVTQKQPIIGLCRLRLPGTPSNRQYVSIFPIIGLIQQLLQLTQQPNFSKANIEDIAQILARPTDQLIHGRFASTAHALGSSEKTKRGLAANDGANDKSAEDEDGETEEGHVDSTGTPAGPVDTSTNLIDAIKTWLNDIVEPNAKRCGASTVLVGRIWSRLYESLYVASDDLRAGAKKRASQNKDNGDRVIGVASIMEMYALCVINAFLVEEIEHHASTDGVSRLQPIKDATNPKFSRDDYIKKLSAWLKNAKDSEKGEANAPLETWLPLTTIVATCPLILGLIQNKDTAQSTIKPSDVLKKLYGSLNADWFCPDDHFAKLNNAKIAGGIAGGIADGIAEPNGQQVSPRKSKGPKATAQNTQPANNDDSSNNELN
jgi:hypothetical protein